MEGWREGGREDCMKSTRAERGTGCGRYEWDSANVIEERVGAREML